MLLEPNDNPAAKEFQRAMRDRGIRAATFFVGNLQEELERMKKLGVKFTVGATKVPESTIAVFDDTSGNLIQLTQPDSGGR